MADWKRSHKFVCHQTQKQSLAKTVVQKTSLKKASCSQYLIDLDAAIAASLQEASERTVYENAQVSDEVMRSCSSGSFKVNIIEVGRDGNWFLKALSQSELEFIRQPPLPSGAHVYVKPDAAFDAVVQHLHSEGWDLKPRHVVCRSEDADLLLGVVRCIAKETPRRQRGNSSCSLKNKGQVDVPFPNVGEGGAADKSHKSTDQDYIVKNTCVYIPVPSSMYSEPSTHANTA